jgi:hypothetical protein
MRNFNAAFKKGRTVETQRSNLKTFFVIIILIGVRLSPLGTAATSGLLYQLQIIDEGDLGEIDGMKIGSGKRSTREKLAPAPL